ncbi:hypothetical protein ACTWPT_42150 [Nonomuraea sp. 3N208]
MKIAVYGASGYQGKLVLAEADRRKEGSFHGQEVMISYTFHTHSLGESGE